MAITLQAAKLTKNDEFYTQLRDIENELRHYKEQLKGKTILCNCDDPYESNFFKYFAASFNHLGLKKLISTSYVESPVAGTQLPLFELQGLKPNGKQPFKLEINTVPDNNDDGAIDLFDVELLLKNDKNTATPLIGNGDFRSEECIELLSQADIVITNPPFSLYRQYIAQLMDYKKQFLIIGDDNWVTLKDTFSLIQEDKMWLGYGRVKEFKQPDGTIKKFGNKCWYTNLDTRKRHDNIELYKKYDPKEYPVYANFDAIEVSRVENIPIDYDGLMGVPITFLSKYNPEQFEIVGSSRGLGRKMSDCGYDKGTYVQGGVRFYLPITHTHTFRCLYDRIVIRRRAKDEV